jgi:hypothetical protein
VSEVSEIGAELVGQVSQPETAGAHTPVSYSIPAEAAGRNGSNVDDESGTSSESADSEGVGIGFGPFRFDVEAGEESGDETQFEAVEGFDENSLTETGSEEADTEATLDAWYGEATESDQQEFFQFLAPLLLPTVKSLLPVIAGAAAKNLPAALASILQRLNK